MALASDDTAERERAFDTLVALYWKPLYKYLRVGRSRTREDAEDLTQSFFVRAFERESLAAYDPTLASFRTFVRMLLDRHVANEEKAAHRLKRGGSDVHLDFADAEVEISSASARVTTPEEYFQQEWARSVFALSVQRLRDTCRASQRETHLALFEACDLDRDERPSYRQLAERFGIMETTVTNHLAAVRRQFRAIVLETLREITATEQEFRAEARALLGMSP